MGTISNKNRNKISQDRSKIGQDIPNKSVQQTHLFEKTHKTHFSKTKKRHFFGKKKPRRDTTQLANRWVGGPARPKRK